MCGNYLAEPVACTPASGWEKGQVENQVGAIRRRSFVPWPRFRSYAELNAWLMDRCIACGRRLRILNVVDDVTKECLAAIVDTSISGRRVARELAALVTRRGRPDLCQRPRHRAHLERHARMVPEIVAGIELILETIRVRREEREERERQWNVDRRGMLTP